MKKTTFIFLILLTLFNNVSAQPETIWQLLMNGDIIRWAYSGGDEFNEGNLDHSKWYNSYPWGRNYSGTCYQEYMTDDQNFEFGYNSEINDNTIKLIAKEEDVYARGVPYETDDYLLQDGQANLRWWNYTSGMICSKQKFKYGLFEMRFKLPSGKGLWPAFWLFGGNPNEEFDIFEYKGETPNKIHIDTHCPSGCDAYEGFLYPTGYGGWVTANGNFSDGFNVMMGEWGPNACFWYLNGQEFAIWLGNFNYQAYLIVNLGIANAAPCAFSPGPDNTTSFPAIFEIDYIRVWTRLDCEQTISMSNYSQNNTDPTVITGQQITMGGDNGNAIVENNEHLHLIATDVIHLKPGFHAKAGSNFSAKIVDCPGPTKNYETSLNKDKLRIISENDTSNNVDLLQDKNPQVNSPLLYTKIHPNPTKGIINIEFEGTIDRNIKIELINSHGQIVYEKNKITEHILTINISNLPKGVYFLKGTYGKKTITDKIILN